MSDPNEKTDPQGPFAIAVSKLLERHQRELRGELKQLIADGNAITAQMIGNALGVWRAEVDQTLNDHELRIRHLEQVIRDARADTDPPPGMQS